MIPETKSSVQCPNTCFVHMTRQFVTILSSNQQWIAVTLPPVAISQIHRSNLQTLIGTVATIQLRWVLYASTMQCNLRPSKGSAIVTNMFDHVQTPPVPCLCSTPQKTAWHTAHKHWHVHASHWPCCHATCCGPADDSDHQPGRYPCIRPPPILAMHLPPVTHCWRLAACALVGGQEAGVIGRTNPLPIFSVIRCQHRA